MEEGLRPGSRWQSLVDDTAVIVVKAGAADLRLECGGHAMIPSGIGRPIDGSATSEQGAAPKLGDCYGDESGLRVIITRAGICSLSANGTDPRRLDVRIVPLAAIKGLRPPNT